MFPINFILTSKHLTTSILAKRRRPNPARTRTGIVVSVLSTAPLFQSARFVTVDILESYLLLKA
jgi:hypothetical protein